MRVLLLVATTLLAVNAWAAGKIVRTNQLFPNVDSIFAELRAGDWLALDLDNTTFRAAQMLGRDEWYHHGVKQLKEKNGEPLSQEILENFQVLADVLMHGTRMVPIEPLLIAKIAELQARGVIVFGLTGRPVRISDLTQRRLLEMGIDFSRVAFARIERAQAETFDGHPFGIKHNIVFAGPVPKGKVLDFVFWMTAHYPRRIVVIDDRLRYVDSLHGALEPLNVEGTVIHYTRAEEVDAFDAAVADRQLAYFIERGHVISDSFARELNHAARCLELLKQGF